MLLMPLAMPRDDAHDRRSIRTRTQSMPTMARAKQGQPTTASTKAPATPTFSEPLSERLHGASLASRAAGSMLVAL